MPRQQQPVDQQDDQRSEFSQALQDATAEPEQDYSPESEVVQAPTVNPFADVAGDLGLPAESLAAMNPADLVKFAVGLMKQNQTQQKEWLGEYQKLLAATPQLQQQQQPEQPADPLSRLLAPDKYDPEFVAPIVEAFNAQKAELEAMKAQLAEAMGAVQTVKKTAQQNQFEAIDSAFNGLTTHHGLFGKVQPVKGSPEYMRRVAVLQSLQVAPIPGMRPEQAVLKRASEMFPTVASTPVVPQAIQDRQQQWRQNGPLAQANAKQPSPLDEGEAQKIAFSKYLKEIVQAT